MGNTLSRTRQAAVAPVKPSEPRVLIIGAGITGLILAQALKQHDIPFTVYERDPSVSARGRGWGLTIHWSLDAFVSLLPQHLVDRLPEAYVNPSATEKGENGHFLFYDLRSGEARWKVPPSKRIRVSRERLRALLLEGLDVQWGKTLMAVTPSASNHITVHFADSSTATGSLVVGADGSRSKVRSSLISRNPALSRNQELPVRLLGVTVVYASTLALKLKALDPFFFQGGDPQTNTFLYFSFLDTPSNNTREDNPDSYECQIILSWPYKVGYMGREEPLDVPKTGRERVAVMKDIAKGWAEPFQGMVVNIPEDADAKAIVLEDFVPKERLWTNMEGRATVVGDAAHAMTMYRGEGANHGIADIAELLESILPSLQNSSGPTFLKGLSPRTLKDAIDVYEKVMIRRAIPAVLTSRRACLDAHDYGKITDQSPLISRRVMVTKE